MSELENFLLGKPTTAPAPATSGAGTDELENFLLGRQQPTLESGTQANDLDTFLTTPQTPPASTGPSRSYWDLFSGGIARNWAQMRAAPHTLQGIAAEVGGDQATMQAALHRALEIERQAGESQWSLQNITGVEDFSYWLTEKLGENALTMLGAMATGGLGAAAGAGIASRMGLSAAARAAVARAGAGTAIVGGATALEAPGTAQEQFGVTGSTMPHLSIPAGFAKGLLEAYMPMRMLSALTRPGRQFGANILGAAGRGVIQEGATEGLQESIDIALRMYSDPNYSFSGNGPFYMGEGAWRLAEATAAGAALGGTVGGITGAIEGRQEARDNALPPGGQRQIIDPNTIPPIDDVSPEQMNMVDRSTEDVKVSRKPHPNPTRNVEIWEAESPQGWISAARENTGNVVHIQSSQLVENVPRGEGYGTALYRKLIDEALDSGYTVKSDDAISREAANVYEGLRRKGYGVTESTGLTTDSDGFVTRGGGGPAYVISSKPSKNVELASVRVTPPRQPAAPAPEAAPLVPPAPGVPPQDKVGNETPVEPSVPPEQMNMIGPITEVRNMVMRNRAQVDRDINEALAPSAREDLVGASPLFRDLPAISQDAMWDLVEANTVRYAVESGPGMWDRRFFNSTDLEYASLVDPQGLRRNIVEVDQGSLQAAGMTANPLDLPPVNSGRVWFLKDAKNPEQLLARYSQLQAVLAQEPGAALFSDDYRAKLVDKIMEHYEPLITAGLRVIPSRGSSFIYNLAFNGRPVDVKTTGRTMQINFFDPVNRSFILPFFEDQPILPAVQAGGLRPVSLDMNRFKKGEIGAFPVYNDQDALIGRVAFREGLSFGQKQSLLTRLEDLGRKTTWDQSFVNEVRQLMKDGIWIEPQASSVGLVTLEPVENLIGKVVFGVDQGAINRVSKKDDVISDDMHLRAAAFPFQAFEVGTFPPSLAQTSPDAKIVQNTLLSGMEVAGRILRSLGIEGGLEVVIFDEIPGLPLVDASNQTDAGRIRFSVKNLRRAANMGGMDLDTVTFNTLMHEIGHSVTFHFYSKLPVEWQQKLRYAYHKTLLLSSVAPGDVVSRVSPEEYINHPGSYYYYLSYVEWLAEQFRRWTYSDSEVKAEIDYYVKEVGAKLDQFYKDWANLRNEKEALNLSNPEHNFSAWMQYYRDYNKEKVRVKQLIRQQQLYMVDESIFESPEKTLAINQTIAALMSMKQMLPKEALGILLSRQLQSELGETEGVIARTINMRDKALIELAVGSLNSEEEFFEKRVQFAHELIHAYRHLGLITEQEMTILYEAALADGVKIDPSYRAQFGNRARLMGLEESEVLAFVETRVREETVATYVERFANDGSALATAKPILERILAFLERVREFLTGQYRSRDAILNAFFKGEMTSRPVRIHAMAQAEQNFMRVVLGVNQFQDMQVDEIRDIGNGVKVAINRHGSTHEELLAEQDTVSVDYVFFKPPADNITGLVMGEMQEPKPYLQALTEDNELLGALQLEISPRGYQVANNVSKVPGFSVQMQDYVQKDLNIKHLAPTRFTPSGYRAFKRRFPEAAKYWVFDDISNFFYSAREVARNIIRWRNQVEMQNRLRETSDPLYHEFAHNMARDTLNYWNRLSRRLPKETWTTDKQILEQMFMLGKNVKADGVSGSMVRAGVATTEQELMQVINQVVVPGPALDHFNKMTKQQMDATQAQAARRLKVPYSMAAPASPEVMNMRKIIERSQGLETSDEVKRYLKSSTITQEADRIGRFTKLYWSLHQLVWRNEHIIGLRNYLQATELFNQTVTSWHKEADDVARQWERDITDSKRREVFAQTLFWLSEQKYRSPAEVLAGVNRHPTKLELSAKLRAEKFTPRELNLLAALYAHPFDIQQGKIGKDVFNRFLDAVEAAAINRVIATTHTPAAQAAAIQKITNEMSALRSKPYFPMTRFGKFTVTVRDVNNNVLFFSAYQQARQRDQAIPQIAARFRGQEITVGIVPEAFFEFMGLPAPLLRAIRENIPNLTPDQRSWLEDFEMLHVGDRTFRGRWLTQSGLPGYSADAFRTFAHYFMSGSRYLARLKHGKEMSDAIGQVRDTLDGLPNSSKRRRIVDYMVAHYDYVMESGRDWAKFKAFVSMWQLGFSPAAAFMNLTQTPVVSLPFLNGTFGTVKGTSQIMASMRAARNLRNTATVKGTGNYTTARLEAVKQGRIDIGQAAELGAYAEGANLLNVMASTKAQKAYRNVSWAAMWMFQKGEQINREIMFHAAWELAKANPTNPRLTVINTRYNRELTDLEVRLSTPSAQFTREDAIAFLFAKEAIDKTQGIYAPYARPQFMRQPEVNVALIFFQYVQLMTYVFRFNPGTVQLLLISAGLYGLTGLPGADDLMEVLTFVGKKIFGENFNLRMQMRRVVRELTRGTIADEVGPDLFLHGISRYGFGLGLLPEGWGLGRFDASANGSLGKLIPGLYEGMHAVNSRSDPRQFVNDVLQRLAGPGMGYAFTVSQFGLESQGSADSHTWERLLPRAVRAVVKANRLYTEGAETTRTGARIVPFSATDPDDMSAIVTQALGFSPTRITSTWELIREQRDALAIFQARRLALYGQFDYAMQRGDSGLRDDVMMAVRRYNAEVQQYAPSMQITVEQLRQSMQGRARARGRAEQLLPNQRNQIPVARDIQDMFPNVRPQQVR